MTRHFLDIDDVSIAELDDLLGFAEDPHLAPVLKGLGVGLVFEKPSNRTRNSSEMATYQLGGHPIYIQGHEVGIDVRESAEDVANTLAGYHAIVCARVFDHRVLERMKAALDAGNRGVPVVNLLSDRAHPCQAVADLLTLREHLAPQNKGTDALVGRSLAYIGDANNMCISLAKAGVMVGMDIRVASPTGYELSSGEVEDLTALARTSGRGGSLSAVTDPAVAVKGVDAIYTDVWTSMGQEDEYEARLAAFAGYCVDDALVDLAAPEAIVLHCLPAHRGEEIAASVVDGPQSVVWRQATHRMTAMRGLFAWLMATNGAPGGGSGA